MSEKSFLSVEYFSFLTYKSHFQYSPNNKYMKKLPHLFVSEFLSESLVLLTLALHLLALLVIVECQLLQCLQHFLHLILGRVILSLDPRHLCLQHLVVTPGGSNELWGTHNR